MPLYLVKVRDADGERLVEASSKAGARNFVARELIAVALAEGSDCHRLAKRGVEIEVAKEEPPTGQPETE